MYRALGARKNSRWLNQSKAWDFKTHSVIFKALDIKAVNELTKRKKKLVMVVEKAAQFSACRCFHNPVNEQETGKQLLAQGTK